MYVRDQLAVVSHKSVEYATWLVVTLPDSSRMNLVNIYLPPATSLARRGIGEDEART